MMKVLPVPEPPLVFPDVRLIEEAADLIVRAKKPLIITGKGILTPFVVCTLFSNFRAIERVYNELKHETNFASHCSVFLHLFVSYSSAYI